MEQRQDLYITFVDLNKAFDSVSKEGLWKILAKFGCLEKFVKMVRLFHYDMVAKVLNDGGSQEPFQVTNGVKQGCVLAPTLFSMMFAAMLMEAFKDSSTGIPIRYRYDGNLFNLRRLQALSKVNETKIRDLLFADNCALNAATEQERQREVEQFSSACDDFGLIINAQKTEVMFQPAPEKPYHKPHILMKGQRLQAVDNFTYLGSTLFRRTNIDDEIKNRIAKASSAFGRLWKKVWEKRGISHSTKCEVYKAVVLTTLL